MNKVPVLLICFNRLSTVEKSLMALRDYGPHALYIAADGPRNGVLGDEEKCQEVRKWIMDHIDWDCHVHTLFREKNIGCGYGPSQAISWMFETEDRGIIIEDDCVPHPEFFHYCEELLARYADDDSVMAINGMQYLTKKYTPYSYYFSMQNSPLCGWATWKRAWRYFDFDLKGMTEKDVARDMKKYGVSRSEKQWWIDIFKNLRKGVYGTSSWDYQFIFSIWHHNGKTIMPTVNLVSNIGFDNEATHTIIEDDRASLPTFSILPLIHPQDSRICRKADYDYHMSYYGQYIEIVPWMTKIKRYIKYLIKKIFRKE